MRFGARLAAVAMAAASSLLVGGTRQPDTPLDIRLDYRSLRPGEVIRITVAEAGDVSQAQARFLDQKFPLGRGTDPSRLMAFVGLDLELSPGRYPLSVSVLRASGRWDEKKLDIVVEPCQFPVRKLWVDEQYVTPPPEVQERIRAESEILRSIYQISSSAWLGEAGFIIPLEGRPADNFGERRIFNNKPRSPHSGQDISAPAGAPVKASASGRVVLAMDLYFSGNTVIIDHGLDVYTVYCHFSKITAVRGAFVKAGNTIGLVGATGRVTGPHLHWSLRVRGSRVDPYSLVGRPPD